MPYEALLLGEAPEALLDIDSGIADKNNITRTINVHKYCFFTNNSPYTPTLTTAMFISSRLKAFPNNRERTNLASFINFFS
jgi:hypothetical protein